MLMNAPLEAPGLRGADVWSLTNGTWLMAGQYSKIVVDDLPPAYILVNTLLVPSDAEVPWSTSLQIASCSIYDNLCPRSSPASR